MSSDVEQSARAAHSPARGTRTAGVERESDVEFHDQGSLPVRLVRCGFAYQVAFVRVLGRFPRQAPLEISSSI